MDKRNRHLLGKHAFKNLIEKIPTKYDPFSPDNRFLHLNTPDASLNNLGPNEKFITAILMAVRQLIYRDVDNAHRIRRLNFIPKIIAISKIDTEFPQSCMKAAGY